ncbi:SAM-dependent methyltransferase [Pontibacillus yanchengensis]|uniref:SAM-dependent methyltransferase n=2 Tax=Pontibacillus yanchengensis TaxID=462910 RepID=A0A6I4ZWK9_9BACI|nr:SAM-dependent methyltransferase [Pontibacillus yanchengensis]
MLIISDRKNRQEEKLFNGVWCCALAGLERTMVGGYDQHFKFRSSFSDFLWEEEKMEKFIQYLMQEQNETFMPFDTFISYALYHPVHGYYQKQRTKIGTKGDFYTSSHVGEIFGKLVAYYFDRVARCARLPLHICEIGGGDGRFARTVCETLANLKRDFKYDLIDISTANQRIASELVNDFQECRVYDSLTAWGEERVGFSGIFFSNEWLDAQPVKVVKKEQGVIYEIGISVRDNKLIEAKRPADEVITKFLDDYEYKFKDGQKMEVPLYMSEQASSLSSYLKKGIIVTVDYGYTHHECSQPSRRNGSLRGYKSHQVIDNILEKPGAYDITHHVHWDTWEKISEEKGLQSVSRTKQNEWLLQLGILDHLKTNTNGDPFSCNQKQNRAIRSFVLGDQMTNSFDVCIQSKNVSLVCS